MIGAWQDIPYCGAAPLPARLWSSWNFDPALIAALCALSLYALRLGSRQRVIWIVGVGALAVAFVSPLCALTSALFSARSVHHILLAAVAAPLLAMASLRSSSGGVVAPLVTSSLVLWVWHWPSAYAAALANNTVYWTLQLALLASFFWFWRSALAHLAKPGSALIAIGASAGQMGLLAAVLTLAPRPLYEAHAIAPLAYGLDALRDQQLAGLLMWVPAFFIYTALAIKAGRQIDIGAHA